MRRGSTLVLWGRASVAFIAGHRPSTGYTRASCVAQASFVQDVIGAFPRAWGAVLIADVVAITEQLGLERPVLVGQSLGGHTAMLTTASHPEMVRGLVLVEAGPDGPNPNGPKEIGDWFDSWATPFPSRAAAAEFFGGGPVVTDWAAGLEKHNGTWHPRFDRDVTVAALTEKAQHSFDHEWRQITCPILVALAQSSVLSESDVDKMLQQPPTTVAMSVPSTNHDLHLERPELLHTTLLEFLDTLT
ncbi:alpha/beta fold hydrolase [Streptomyces phaeochromogenes]|uniref:alpha/beta fold hydrolase n=1 Tax=Streptomyces phaeochromogenes TaxID=1923 RepID=UPI00099F1C7A|nr:alpha/beta hydrolase [Streptomyces phaeochromogenes]